MWVAYGGVAQLGERLNGIQEVKSSILSVSTKTVPLLIRLYLQGYLYFSKAFEGRAVQSNNPVDCCDRKRPSRRSGTNRIPCSPPKPGIVDMQRFRAFFFRTVYYSPFFYA